MHPPYRIPLWKTAPFCRILLPFIAGIILQWYLQFLLSFIILSCACFTTAFLLVYFLQIEIRFKIQSFQGMLLQLMIVCFAMFITWNNDIRHQQKWFGHYYNDSAALIIRLAEPLVEKSRSYKCDAFVEEVINDGRSIPVKGKLLVYFSKDSSASSLRYGDEILVSRSLQVIKNSGNPGAFNYERYAAFQHIFHNVYLKQSDWVLLKEKRIDWLDVFIFSTRSYIINALQKYLPHNKNELGIAEALLIGYKEDLDKDLVQAYSNTGVVHIIAISGLHLGLIYVMLVWIFNHLPFIKRSSIIKVALILLCLWFFSLLTGASASVLRSAVMFTCIVIGKNFFSQSSIYNSLAASAFLLLCYNPYFLWDVGFQLSYLAVIGIVWLQQPVYHLFYIKNKWLDKLWNMIAVTLAAQVITFPICIYYFHQFPNLFLITNLLAVPLSTIILFAEIFLVAFSWIKIIAFYTGKIIYGLVWLMNFIIQTCNGFSFSLWDNIYANILSTWLLYLVVISACCWIFYKSNSILRLSLTAILLFSMVHVVAKFKLRQQKKIVVYNVPQHKAVDFISADKYVFVGDSVLLQDGLLQNFHLKPARIALQTRKRLDTLSGLSQTNNSYVFFNRKIILLDKTVAFVPLEKKIAVDILLISGNPTLKISTIAAAVIPSIIVFDASNSLWKIAAWKKDCERLFLRCHSVPEEGAFILDVGQ